jgi:broad specificity phosphatase PhoE
VTLLYLIRHGEHELQDRVMVGRAPGIGLSREGRGQAERLAARLGNEGIEDLRASPSHRALETARPLAKRLGLDVQVAQELDEIDVGSWTGRPMSELTRATGWANFNSFRSGTPAPEGEWMLDVQRRMVGLVERLRRDLPCGRIALVSHGDPIKAALLFYLGLSLDLFLRIEVGTGSISRIEVEDWGARVIGLNEVPR